MKKIKNIAIFIKKYWKWFAMTLGIVSLILCLYWGINDIKQLNIIKKKVELAKYKKEIAMLESRLELLQNSKLDTSREIEKIDAELVVINDNINKSKRAILKLTLEQKIDSFNRMGY